jgi:hypothetical protein
MVQEPLSTEIIEERTMGRGRKKEQGPCGDGEKYRDMNGEIRTWHATKKPLGRPASKKTLATGVVHVASPVQLSPVPVLPNAICIDMDQAEDVQAPITEPIGHIVSTSEEHTEVRADWVAEGMDCFSGLKIISTWNTGVKTTKERARYDVLCFVLLCLSHIFVPIQVMFPFNLFQFKLTCPHSIHSFPKF